MEDESKVSATPAEEAPAAPAEAAPEAPAAEEGAKSEAGE